MLVKNPIESILALASSVFGAYSVVLFDVTDNGQKARLIAACSQGDHIDQNTVVVPGRGLVGWILRNGSPISVDSIDENRAYLGYYEDGRELEICSFLGCPLPDGGILCVDSRERGAFPPQKQKLIAVFADMLSQVRDFGNARDADAEAPRKSVFLDALAALAELRKDYPGWKNYLRRMLPIVADAAGFSYAAFASRAGDAPTYIVEGESRKYLLKDSKAVELPLHSGVVGWVLRNGEELFNDGSSGTTPLFGKLEGLEEFSAAVCIPVRMEKKLCGVLCLAAADARTFPDEIRTFVRLAADDLGRLLEVLALRYRIRMVEKERKEN